MTELRKSNTKGHYLRNQKCDTYKIVTDQNMCISSGIDDNNNEMLEKYGKFTTADINVPLAEKSGAESANTNDNSKISQTSSSTTTTPDNSNKGAQAAGQEFHAQAPQKKVGKKMPMIKVPDLFKNVKIKKNNYLQYKRVNLDKFGPPTNEGSIIPDHYVKYIDPCNTEVQNTEEKNWTFDKKLYEITEVTIANLKKYKIDISPANCEWVIDCFEKIAINDKKQSKLILIQEFRKRVPPEVSAKVSDEAMGQIYDHCWKTQREQRANRSFIRLFWWYQDKVGDDNFNTFAQQAQKSRPCVRLKIQAQVNNYCNCFIERESSSKLCYELQAMSQKIYQEIDVWRLEDAQFDMLIGKEPSDPRFSFLNSKQPITELSILQNQQMQIPFKTKSDSPDIIDKMNSMSLQEVFQQSDRYLHFVVHESRTPPILEQNVIPQNQLQAESNRPHHNSKLVKDDNPKNSRINKIQKEQLIQNKVQPVTNPRNKVESVVDDPSVALQQQQSTTTQQNIVNNKNKTTTNNQEPKADQNDPSSIARSGSQNKKIKDRKDNNRLKDKKTVEQDNIMAVTPQPNNNLETDKFEQSDKDHDQHTQNASPRSSSNASTLVVQEYKPKVEAPPKKIAKIKRKKYQKIGREMIRLISMIMAKQQETIGLKIHPEKTNTEKVDITNTEKIIALQNYNYQFSREQLDKLKNNHLQHVVDQRQERCIEMTKKYRIIEQETLICSYQATDQYQFDFINKKVHPLDEYEKLYRKNHQKVEDSKEDLLRCSSRPLVQTREQGLQHKNKLKKVQENYEALKNRQFQARRGRNNRILYKSQLKTIYGYESQDNQQHEFTHDVMDDMLIKMSENQMKKKEKQQKESSKSYRYIDKWFLDKKMLANDLERYCMNKRLKKNIYKMDMVHNLHNGQRQGIESSVFTQASYDYDRIPRQTEDPVIKNLHKRMHASSYQSLMSYEGDRQLFKSGVILDNVYEKQGTLEQKLQLYNDLQSVNNNDKVTFGSALTDPHVNYKSISNPDKLQLLRNVKLMKEEQAFMLESHKTDIVRHKQLHDSSAPYHKSGLLNESYSFKNPRFMSSLQKEFQSFKMQLAGSTQQDYPMYPPDQKQFNFPQTIE